MALSSVEIFLTVIAVLLFLILYRLGSIDARLKEKFPTDKEQDREWSQKDPMGHSGANQKTKGN